MTTFVSRSLCYPTSVAEQNNVKEMAGIEGKE
jgi:hypothetical protein